MVVDTFADATHVEKMLEERRLISRILAGDATAERQLYDTHVDRVFRLAYRMTGDATQAEDLTQDTFIRAFDRLADFRMDGPFAGWLHRVATSVILTGLRKRKRMQSVESVRDDLEWAAGAGLAVGSGSEAQTSTARSAAWTTTTIGVRDARHGRLHTPGDRHRGGRSGGNDKGPAVSGPGKNCATPWVDRD